MFTGGCVECMSMGQVSLGCSLVGVKCVKCVSTGEVCPGCSLVGV